MSPFITPKDSVQVTIVILGCVVGAINTKHVLGNLLVNFSLPRSLDSEEEGVGRDLGSFRGRIVAALEREKRSRCLKVLNPAPNRLAVVSGKANCLRFDGDFYCADVGSGHEIGAGHGPILEVGRVGKGPLMNYFELEGSVVTVSKA